MTLRGHNRADRPRVPELASLTGATYIEGPQLACAKSIKAVQLCALMLHLCPLGRLSEVDQILPEDLCNAALSWHFAIMPRILAVRRKGVLGRCTCSILPCSIEQIRPELFPKYTDSRIQLMMAHPVNLVLDFIKLEFHGHQVDVGVLALGLVELIYELIVFKSARVVSIHQVEEGLQVIHGHVHSLHGLLHMRPVIAGNELILCQLATAVKIEICHCTSPVLQILRVSLLFASGPLLLAPLPGFSCLIHYNRKH
mmetsp:Transcript_244/g.706  ORF Transcript_244/g.706 Transcript_244/m.706 type:complete len:255 (-) Transcript_244:757-1521(-)